VGLPGRRRHPGPARQDESFTKANNALVYERLLQPGKDMSPTAWLAASWKVVSPTQRLVYLAAT
jgi:hypothetical protein